MHHEHFAVREEVSNVRVKGVQCKEEEHIEENTVYLFRIVGHFSLFVAS